VIGHWELAIRPLLEAARPRTIVEVGIGKGATTRRLLAYAVEHGAVVHAIDPRPELDVGELRRDYGVALVHHQERSLVALDRIEDPDVVLLDGDHNWYTVLNELRLLARARRDGNFPLTLLHDVDWPYGRRDLYYEPDEIPAAYRQPHSRGGMVPGADELSEGGGLNPKLANALHEGGPRNGVRTAVEDFLAETDRKLRSRVLHGTHGLGVLADKRMLSDDRALKEALRRLGSSELLADQTLHLERLRVDESLRAARRERELAKVERRLETAREELVAREGQLERSIATAEAVASELAQHADGARRAEGLRERSDAALATLRAEHEQLRAAAERDRAALEELRAERLALMREREEALTGLERLERALEQEQTRTAQETERLHELEGRFATAMAEVERRDEALEALAGERAELARGLVEREAELERAVASKRRARERIEELERTAAADAGQRERLRAELGARDDAAGRAQLGLELAAADLERAASSRAWRYGHALMRFLRRLSFRRAGQTSGLDRALHRLRQAQVDLGGTPAAAPASRTADVDDPDLPGSLPETAELETAHELDRTEVIARAHAAADARALATRDERARLASVTLTGFRERLQRGWLDDAESLNADFVRRLGLNGRQQPLRVLVGTLASGENELEQCRRSVGRQSYPLEHVVLSGLGKKEAVATLMERFLASDADVLLKLDADMVLLAPDYVERVVEIMRANPELELLQMALLDYFSGAAMQGVNAYRRTLDWRPERQDPLFTDRSFVDKSKRLVTWAPFLRDAIHAPDPSPLHAYHFGVHRGMKVLQPGRERFDLDQAVEQATYLERTREHFRLRRDPRLGLACLGFEQALRGEFELAHLDYTDPALEQAFAEHAGQSADELDRELEARRARRVPRAPVEGARRRARHAAWRADAEIRSVLVLLPHLGMYGGVNRFFELARCFGEQGVECVIATPDDAPHGGGKRLPRERPDYPGVRTVSFSEALGRSWDAVLCGDCTSGAMLTLPLFEARVSAVYLLNGWMRREANVRQMRLVEPDVVIANSSYCARYYADLAPIVIPGGVDLETFRPTRAADVSGNGDGPHAATAPLRVAAYAGRRKPIKRFDDVVAACTALHETGVGVELHVYDEREVELDVPFTLRSRGPLVRQEVRALLSEVDVFVSAEADAGWSNPTAEAMACGAAVVCTEAGTTDYAIDGETALVVPTAEPTAMAAAIGRLAVDVELRRALAAAGSERIRAFGWPAVTRRLGDALADVARDGERRGLLNERARKKIAGSLR
jgi:glycosyltransferase involved in cell wall biosynthesis